ncbi:hypothetical protein M0R45_004855 [Rubus argutus]|uniref:Cyclic nucleotide-binding domain-containing protein n=1 Tax=Rubus argutus TaxID=59490 RepID=A0AAW1YKY0_RUBAR
MISGEDPEERINRSRFILFFLYLLASHVLGAFWYYFLFNKRQHVGTEHVKSIVQEDPLETQKSLKYFLCMQTLIKVPKLENLKSKALTLIIAYLKPVVFQDSIIFQIGVPLDRILFITEGLIWTYEAAATSNTNSCNSQDGKEKTGFSFLHKGGFYGDDQLLSWAIASQKNDLCFDNLPISNANVKCHGK